MIRIIGAILIAFTGAAWGINKSNSLKNKINMCDRIIEMILKTEQFIRYNGYDVYGIVRELGEYGLFTEFNDILSENVEDFNAAACRYAEKITGDVDEQKILLNFWGELGSSDSEGQLKMLKGLYERTSRLYDVRSAEYAKYGRLYRSVGVLMGMMAGIALV